MRPHIIISFQHLYNNVIQIIVCISYDVVSQLLSSFLESNAMSLGEQMPTSGRCCSPSICHKPLTRLHSNTPLKTWITSNSAVRTSDITRYYLVQSNQKWQRLISATCLWLFNTIVCFQQTQKTILHLSVYLYKQFWWNSTFCNIRN
jgi:hypothetical protein